MPYSPWTFCVLTFGCKVNQYESQSLREAWLAMNGKETDDPSEADVVLLHTCAVTAAAVADARRAASRLRREAPKARIVVAGCAAETDGKALSLLPGVAAVVGRAGKPLLLERPPATQLERLNASFAQGSFPARDRAYPPFSVSGFRRARPVLKVQDGCSHGCAYCVVPLTRGPARSRSPRECLAELRRLLDAGRREIVLSGVNLRQYAVREGDVRDFWDLLAWLDRELAPEWSEGARPDPARLRVSSVDPAQLTPRAVDVLAASRLVCPHLHVSLQSGSPAVLSAMRRGHYGPEGLIEAVRALSGVWRRFGLGVDVLVGFPGETEAHLSETLDVLRALPLTYAHVFPFSARPGTIAAGMPNQVEKTERRSRAARVRALAETKRRAFWEASLSEERLLIALDRGDDEEREQGLRGVDACYAPCRLVAPAREAGHALVPARPLRAERDGLVAEPILS